MPEIVIIDDEEIAQRRERPSQTGVGAEEIRVAVVLHVTVHLQIGRDVEAHPRADETLRELPLAQSADVACAAEFHDEQRRRLPGRRQTQLVQTAAVEVAEPPGRLRAEPALGGKPPFDAVAIPVIRADGDRHASCDFEWRHQSLAGRYDVELESVTAFEPPVDRREKSAVALPVPIVAGDERAEELVEHLTHMQPGDRMRRSRLKYSAEVQDLHIRTWHESERWIEAAAQTLVGRVCLPEIVGIVDGRPKRRVIAGETVTRSRESPRADGQIFVAQKPR